MLDQPTARTLHEAVLGLRGAVLAVGDIMLDVFTYGECTRISPEVPIPVLRVSHEVGALGGIGNVAALGGMTFLLAPIGDDADGRTVEALV